MKILKEIGLFLLVLLVVYFVVNALRYWICTANKCSPSARTSNATKCSTKCNFWKSNDWIIINEGND